MGHSVDLVFHEHRILVELDDQTDIEIAEDSPSGFNRYKELQREDRSVAMLAIPNSCLIRASRNYIVDPGVAMQGAPYTLGIQNLGVDPFNVEDVILTHMHQDHVGALIEFPGRRAFVHEVELEAPYAHIWSGLLETVEVIPLSGEEGELENGLRWMRTPGHAEGLITLLVDTDDGLVAIPSDCVGPLPEYFEQMDLPEHFPERETLLEQWRKIRALEPSLIIPGHYPPFAP